MNPCLAAPDGTIQITLTFPVLKCLQIAGNLSTAASAAATQGLDSSRQ